MVHRFLFGLEASETLNDEYWAELLAVRSEVNKVLEQARTDKQLRGSLEAAVTLYADKALAEKLECIRKRIAFCFTLPLKRPSLIFMMRQKTR